MRIGRRDFLKMTATGGLALACAPTLAQGRPHHDLPPAAVGILYDATLCVGCQACMVACKQANEMEVEPGQGEPLWDAPRDLSARTLNIIKRYENGDGAVKDRAENGYSFVKRHCMHCLDPACVSACPVSALTKDPASGIVGYNEKACIGCRYCQVACPYNIPKFQWDSTTPKIVKCQLCSHLVAKGGISACCKVCPTGASLFGPVEGLLAEAKRRLHMEEGKSYDFPVASLASGQVQSHRAGRYLEHIYGENEAGGSQVLLLSGVPFTSLGLPELPEQSFVEVADGIQYAIYKGMVYPLVLLGGLIYIIRKRVSTTGPAQSGGEEGV
ncbi:MAG: hydrogenase 2 operon protein HybA [Desulfobulbaceae bacterium]|nr:hydrogenase 2 operon protein HybA [Desulfobulbaceae bacterium]